MAATDFTGNRRFVNNLEQQRCRHCNAYVKDVKPDGRLKHYQCWRCGPVLEYV